MTLGSLFDGIGGWLLAAKHAGVKPIWSSEIEKFPCAVTAHHFPEVKQLGDITKIDGAEIEPVDIICAGSPCQDLSIAGKQEGLKGARSGLFLRAVDIVRRMRRATNGEYPRYFVWENVPGAFSSNRGLDFRTVLEEISQTEIPMPKDNKWANAGVVEWGDGSLAWRVLDAQYWGVPQRRKRIFLVADFGGQSAGEILFEREGVPRHSQAGREAREGAAEGVGDGTQNTGWDGYQHWQWRKSDKYGPLTTGCGRLMGDTPLVQTKIDVPSNARSLTARANGSPCIDRGPQIIASHPINLQVATRHIALGKGTGFGVGNNGDPAYILEAGHSHAVAVYDMTHTDEVLRKVDGGKSNTLNARMGTGGNQVPVVHAYSIAGNTIDRKPQNGGNGAGWQKDVSYTLNTMDRHAVAVGNGQMHQTKLSDKVGALNTMHDQQCVMNYFPKKTGALCARDYKGIGNQYVHDGKCIVQKSVRRLTPTECERLQGLPDNYTLIDDKSCSDTARYKALGNGMAQPCADWVIKRIKMLAGVGKWKQKS